MGRVKDTYEEIVNTCAVQLLLAECTDGIDEKTYESIKRRFGKFAAKMPTFDDDVWTAYEAVVCGY